MVGKMGERNLEQRLVTPMVSQRHTVTPTVSQRHTSSVEGSDDELIAVPSATCSPPKRKRPKATADTTVSASKRETIA